MNKGLLSIHQTVDELFADFERICLDLRPGSWSEIEEAATAFMSLFALMLKRGTEMERYTAWRCLDALGWIEHRLKP